MASWIKLLVIMHVDKIDAKRGKQFFFFIKPQVLTCIFLFFEIYTEGHFITNHQKDIPKIRI